MLRTLQEILGDEQLMLTYLRVFVFKSVIDHEFVGDVLRPVLHFRFSLRILRLLSMRNHLIIIFISLSAESEAALELGLVLCLIWKSDSIVK
jgi:hypothetical protein